MTTAYPNKIDTSTELPITVDKVTSVEAAVINRLRNAIIAIQQELGVNPSGDQSSVKERFDVVFGLIADLQDIAGGEGVVGPAGPQGPAGSNGVAGAQGSTGPQGPSGTAGTIGPTGPQGIQGEIGPTGPAGSSTQIISEYRVFDANPGLTYATITVGNTTSVDIGGYVTNFGLHTYDFVFPASWTGGGVTVSYLLKDRSLYSETISTPGPSGGTVSSTVVSINVESLTCANPASGTFSLKTGNDLCIANAPISEFLSIWGQENAIWYPVNENLTLGFCKISATPGGVASGFQGGYHVLYRL